MSILFLSIFLIKKQTKTDSYEQDTTFFKLHEGKSLLFLNSKLYHSGKIYNSHPIFNQLIFGYFEIKSRKFLHLINFVLIIKISSLGHYGNNICVVSLFFANLHRLNQIKNTDTKNIIIIQISFLLRVINQTICHNIKKETGINSHLLMLKSVLSSRFIY